MKTKLIPYIIILAGILFAVSIKSITGSHFRNDARKLAVHSTDHSNLITPASIKNLKGENLFVQIDDKEDPAYTHQIALPADRILDRENLSKITKHRGNIILVSEDEAKAARVWMLLAQMGIKNLYILQ